MEVIKKVGIQRGLEDMQDQMERMMEEVVQHLSRSFLPGSPSGFAPPMDLYETPEEILILVEMAGMRSEEIQVLIDTGVLRISGVRTNPICDPQRRVHQMEIDFGPFERRIRIRVPVQEEKIQAVYRDGFLLIRVPKGAELSREILVK